MSEEETRKTDVKDISEPKDTPDLVEKEFISFRDVFADVINALIYEGQQVVDPENLFSGPTEYIYQGRERLRNLYQDITAFEIVSGIIMMAYQIANQSTVDEKALLRKAGYTGAAYVEQYADDLPEICPVSEFVLYWGKGKWNDEYNTMQNLFREKKIPQELWEYIDDLKLNVWEMRRLPKEVRDRFRSDMRIVLDFLAGESLDQCEHKVKHKEALLKMIRVLSGEKNVDNTKKFLEQINVKEDDDIMVCELFDQYERRGREKGLQEGLQNSIAICKDFGASFEETMARIKEKFQLSDIDAQEKMKLYW